MLGLALACLAILSFPALLHPTQLLAHPTGEGNNHYWMLWRAFQSGPVSNLPEGLPIPLMDPVNLVLAAPLMPLSPALAFNAVVLGNLLLAFGGAFFMARELGAQWRAASVAGVAAMSAPVLWGIVSFGLTESLPVGWLALALGALHRFARTGGHPWWILAGLCLGAFGLSGWYSATFAVPAVLTFSIWLLVQHRSARTLGGLLGAGVLAGAMVLPALLDFLEVREFWSERWHPPAPEPPPFLPRWRTLPNRGTDLLNLILPSLEREAVSKSVYLGWTGLLLALAAGKKGRGLWAGVVLLLLLTLGHWLSIGGNTELLGRPWKMPAGLLSDWIPQLQGLTHWHRAAAPASVLLAVATGLGVQRLSQRVQWVWIPAVVGLLAESILLSQNPWPREQIPTEIPAVFSQLSEPGGVVILPFDNGRVDFSGTLPRRYNLWQPRIGRPMAENYEGPDALLSSSLLMAAADGLCGVPETTPRTWRVPKSLRDPARARKRGQAAHLHDLQSAGIRYVLLDTASCPDAEAASELLQDALGAPRLGEGGYRVWELPPAP
ncbi:MAG: hypothetical protein VX899_15675 [Myxococcota bacterium]|nr:hypothetical protein [Myxococcota bacterium]